MVTPDTTDHAFESHEPLNVRIFFVTCLLVVALTDNALAQIPLPLPAAGNPEDTVVADPFRFDPPVSPIGALWRSMLLPGWGQAVLNRRVTGAVFVFWEGVTILMMTKSLHQLSYLRSIDSDIVDDKKQEVEDWAILLGFNHLLAGLEAFVSATLWDFPTDIQIRALPQGGIGVGARLRLH